MVRHMGSRLILTLLIVSLTTTVLNCRVHSSQNASFQVEHEFNSISPPLWATKVEDARIIKTSGGLVGAHYSTDRSFAEITDYYDKQLVANGYKRLEQKSIKSLSGVDYGESTVNYCKGHLKAELYDPGRSFLKHPFQYSFNVSFDAFDCK
jgi:hypothetical protein